MLLMVLLFGLCVLNAIAWFITTHIKSIKLQMVVAQYISLNNDEAGSVCLSGT